MSTAETAGKGEDLFEPVYGHSGAKYRLRAALRDGDTHILLVGPPGSGKSVFLETLDQKLPGVRYVDGESVRKSRMKDLLSENPPILLADELDEMDYDTYRTIAVPMESGRVVKESSREQYDVEIDTQFIGACNSTDRIPDHILSRMQIIHFEKYSTEEFYGVCRHFLPRTVEWVDGDDHADAVAKIALEVNEDTDPRFARDVAKMASGPDDLEKVARAMRGEDVDGEVSLRPEDVARTRDDVMSDKLTDVLVCEALNPGDCGYEAPPDPPSGGKTVYTEAEKRTRAEVETEIEKSVEAALAE